MVVIRFDEPTWATIIRTAAPEIAATLRSIDSRIRSVTIQPDVEARRVLVRCSTSSRDHYGTGFELTEQLAGLPPFVDHGVALRIVVDGLQLDVPGDYFTNPGDGPRRRRWATLSRSELVPPTRP